MAEQTDMKYVAIATLDLGGARAYNVGDLVHASQVEGPGAWLRIGEDVERRAGTRLDLPPRNASQARWAAYAAGEGLSRDEADTLSRDELVARYAPAEPAKAEAEAADDAPED